MNEKLQDSVAYAIGKELEKLRDSTTHQHNFDMEILSHEDIVEIDVKMKYREKKDKDIDEKLKKIRQNIIDLTKFTAIFMNENEVMLSELIFAIAQLIAGAVKEKPYKNNIPDAFVDAYELFLENMMGEAKVTGEDVLAGIHENLYGEANELA